MNPALAILSCLALSVPLLSGCVSKAKAEAQARAAFMAGQQQALQQIQAHGPSVTVIGEVRNKFIPWTAELTLAKAIVAAEYVGTTDPIEIVIHRSGEQIILSTQDVLAGSDAPLQPRDIVELKR